MPTLNLDFECSEWAEVLSPDYDYIFIRGGRDSGKSHEVAGYIVEQSVYNADDKTVCLREFQKSIAKSSKSVIEGKIKSSNSGEMFNPIATEIRRNGGDGLIYFQGMNDHTADSVKSLEGFKRAWFEEAQNCSKRSLTLLIPTIRMEGAQIIFTWNPEFPDDPIEEFAKQMKDDPRSLHLHINYNQNMFLTERSKRVIKNTRDKQPDEFGHIYLGEYNLKSELRVFHNYRTDIIEDLNNWDGPYYGADWGFSQDPTVLLRAWLDDEGKRIYVDHQIDKVGVETDHMPAFFDTVPETGKHQVRGDSARPEMISYLNRHGHSVKAVEKGKGSVEDGVSWLKGYEIISHPRCNLLQKELRLYSYKTNKAGDILPKVDDKASNDHCIDSLRYAFEPLIKRKGGGFIAL